MAGILKKTLQSLANLLPGREQRSSNDEIKEISEPYFGELQQYGCDGCGNRIEEGSKRYNCDDCPDSFDLCQSCYEKGEIVDEHVRNFDHLHTFTCETRSNAAIVREVMAEGTLEEILLRMFRCYADRPAIGTYIESRQRYEYISFKVLEQLVTSFAMSLYHVMSTSHAHLLGTNHTPLIALCSVVRLEWYIADYACALIGIPSVGITASSDKETISFILSQTETPLVVCSQDKLSIFASLASNGDTPGLKHIIVMDLNEGEDVAIMTGSVPPVGVTIWRLTEFLKKGKDQLINIASFKTDPEQIYTIAYTSGSTGTPKGCVFSRSLWLKHILSPSTIGFMGIKRIWFSFQPPSHMMERESFHMTLLGGYKAGIYRGTIEHLFDDMRMVRPTVITSTPRFFLTIYNKYQQALLEEYRQYLSKQDKPVSQTGTDEPPSPDSLDLSQAPYEVKDIVKDRFNEYFGGRERLIGVGGAAVPPPLIQFLSRVFNGLVQDGYGTTEAGGIAGGGYTYSGVHVKLRDVPEMGYLTTDIPPRGEICVKTDTMISGYYKNTKDTDEKFQDGYFCTGDIGTVDSIGQVTIIDRKKNIFKLSQGEFVAPEKLENIFENGSRLIEQVFIHGSIWRDGVIGLVVPHKDALEKWWIENNTIEEDSSVPDIKDLCTLRPVVDLFLSELRRVGEKHCLPGWEIPSSILLEPNPFSQENKLLTCTLKKSRPQLELRYREELERLYEEPSGDKKTSIKRSIEDNVMIHLISVMKNNGIPIPPSCSLSKYSTDDAPPINVSLTLTQMGGDSLAAMFLSNLIQDELGVAVPALKILKEPLSSLFYFVVSQISPSKALEFKDSPFSSQTGHASFESGPGRNDAEINWQRETSIHFLHVSSSVTKLSDRDDIPRELDDEERSEEVTKKENLTDDQIKILLTGSTGFLGRFILWNLLNSEKCGLVYCLCRGDNGKERLLNILKKLQVELSEMKGDKQGGGVEEKRRGKESSFSKMVSKLVVLSGDLGLVRLGLSEGDYNLIAREVDVVIHNGANVNHVLSYTDLKPTNVTSTKEILKLCSERIKHKYLHFVSSIGVLIEGGDETTEVKKDRLRHCSGYCQSKWVSEQLVLGAIDNGYIKGSLSRPGLIGAHSVTGHLNRTDWFYLLVCGLYHLKAYPSEWGTGKTLVIPVDTVAQAVVALSLNRISESNGLVYHLDNRESVVNFNDIIRSLEKAGPDSLKHQGNQMYSQLLLKWDRLHLSLSPSPLTCV
ncbi:PREDICTED: carboxylic acid reductase-like isoform X1 [Amphimedon queenslandica]|uniref:long-chain-fatty-acid--CoA ligase n=2 Tax=Amphimedon queenslandica TaxID=400682 RepID=A0AAN0JN01_AMPQE|nr:PREDICTED: carboxylic acid reductase-like isoform X1 [Amphimedon queenslandica]|eukprot:XP_019858162.1 PREDICTED: carboxylic acid reductase-like isoform X1 [Amphimedon queenslandica]